MLTSIRIKSILMILLISLLGCVPNGVAMGQNDKGQLQRTSITAVQKSSLIETTPARGSPQTNTSEEKEVATQEVETKEGASNEKEDAVVDPNTIVLLPPLKWINDRGVYPFYEYSEYDETGYFIKSSNKGVILDLAAMGIQPLTWMNTSITFDMEDRQEPDGWTTTTGTVDVEFYFDNPWVYSIDYKYSDYKAFLNGEYDYSAISDSFGLTLQSINLFDDRLILDSDLRYYVGDIHYWELYEEDIWEANASFELQLTDHWYISGSGELYWLNDKEYWGGNAAVSYESPFGEGNFLNLDRVYVQYDSVTDLGGEGEYFGLPSYSYEAIGVYTDFSLDMIFPGVTGSAGYYFFPLGSSWQEDDMGEGFIFGLKIGGQGDS